MLIAINYKDTENKITGMYEKSIYLVSPGIDLALSWLKKEHPLWNLINLRIVQDEIEILKEELREEAGR